MSEEEKQEVTPSYVAAHILNEAPEMDSIVVAYKTRDGTVSHFASGNMMTQVGLIETLRLVLRMQLEEFLSEDPAESEPS